MTVPGTEYLSWGGWHSFAWVVEPVKLWVVPIESKVEMPNNNWGLRGIVNDSNVKHTRHRVALDGKNTVREVASALYDDKMPLATPEPSQYLP